jgi:TetR/AcrR family transcriptional regulator
MQLIMNMMSLCIFPFIGKPMMMAISGVEQKQFELLMKQRKKVVADILVASIKK